MVVVFVAFLCSIFFDVISIGGEIVKVCGMIGIGCCFSPFFELLFDLCYRVQDERDKDI